MRIFLAAAFLVLLIVFPATSAEKVFPYRCRKETLPNGLRVLMIPMPSPGLVSYQSVVRTGSRDEVEPGHSGFAHFFEHMMFRGTKKHPGPVYDRIVTSLGAQANAYTTDDFTVFHLTFAKEDLEKVIEIESDRFQNLNYGEAGVSDRGGRGLRRISHRRRAARVRARREAAGPGLRRPHLQAHDDRLRGRRQGDARRPTITASRSTAASIGRRTSCC